jgi:hypothetical protein
MTVILVNCIILLLLLLQLVREADDDGDPGELRHAGDVRALPRREGARLR